MSADLTARTFECPHCAAALTAQAGETMVRCPYCGSEVLVPAELRAASAPPAAATPGQAGVAASPRAGLARSAPAASTLGGADAH